MKCAWVALLRLLPLWLRDDVDKLGKGRLQELRLRIGQPPELVLDGHALWLRQHICENDLQYCINMASEYSPWCGTTASSGYITAQGGHRIGICGEAITENGSVKGIRKLSSLCIRVARDIPNVSKDAQAAGSLLIIGSPGSGKTTFLRDLIRRRSETGEHICVVDERQELFPYAEGQSIFHTGPCTDVLLGVPKVCGVEIALRCMSPDAIALDEITAAEDTQALVRACFCGVKLLATAHAGSIEDLKRRTIYTPIIQSGLFTELIVLHKDKTWTHERMAL